MDINSRNVEIINNRQKNLAKPKSKLEFKNFFNKKSVIIYSTALVAIVAVVAFGFNSSQAEDTESAVASTAKTSTVVDNKVSPVDEASEANVVANLAETANLPVAATAAERSISISVMQGVNQTTDSSLAKPQIVSDSSTSKDVTVHTVQSGETAESIASANGISVQTLKWSNGLKNSEVTPGQQLKILPVNGIVHKVQAGETAESIAAKYGANADRIVSYNDLELAGVTPDEEIIIPSGILPETERPEYEAPSVAANDSSNSSSTTPSGSSSVTSSRSSTLTASVGNRYAYGYCTWYAYERRMQLGRPVGSFWGNASSWSYSASAAGFTVNNKPAVGAVMQNGGGYGHVAVVERVNSDGSIYISEMNGPAGWNVIGYRTIDAATAGSYSYIH